MSHISEGSCLRFPEHIPPAREVTYEVALSMLLRAMSMAQNVPFSWGYIDKPSGLFLVHPFFGNKERKIVC